jgi:hypothetical protein
MDVRIKCLNLTFSCFFFRMVYPSKNYCQSYTRKF